MTHMAVVLKAILAYSLSINFVNQTLQYLHPFSPTFGCKFRSKVSWKPQPKMEMGHPNNQLNRGLKN